MSVNEWLYGGIALLVGLHVLTLLYAYRRRGDPAAAGAESDADARPQTTDSTDEEAVSCPHCGARNEAGYQFCAQCVADLSSMTPHTYQAEQGQPY